MSPRVIHLGVLLSLAAALFAGSATAQQPEPEEQLKQRAKTMFEQGVADYAAGSFERALANFQEAYRLKPHPLVRVNMANCYDKLGMPLQAIFHFERFLEANVGSPEQRQEVTTALRRLRRTIGEVQLRVSPDGAEVTIDDGETRRAPIMDAVKLTAGSHRIAVRLDGYRPSERQLEVTGGSTVEVEIRLERDEAPVVAAAPAPPPAAPAPPPEVAALPAVADDSEPAPEPVVNASDVAPLESSPGGAPLVDESPSSGIPASVWIAGGVSAAFLMSATVAGILALDADSDFDDRRQLLASGQVSAAIDRVRLYNEASDAADRANSLALASDILLVAALLGAGATTYLYIKHRRRERLSLGMHAGPDGAGLRLHGEF